MKIKAVEMTRKIRDTVYKETRDMTVNEFLNYVHKRNKSFRSSISSKRHSTLTK